MIEKPIKERFMPTSMKTLIYILLIFCLTLSACGIKGPDPIPWETPSTFTNMGSNEKTIEDGLIRYIYRGNDLIEITFSSYLAPRMRFEIIDGEYYLSCGESATNINPLQSILNAGKFGTPKKIDNGAVVVKELEIKTKAYESAKSDYESAKNDASGGKQGGVIGGIIGALVCTAKFLICLAVIATVGIGAYIGATISHSNNLKNKEAKLKETEEDLKNLYAQYCG